MSELLVFGDSRSSALRHELPLGVPDLCAYAEHAGRRYLFVGAMEEERLSRLCRFEILTLESLGLECSLGEGNSRLVATQEAVGRGCNEIGLVSAVTPSDFPLGVAEYLSSVGIKLKADPELFEARRRCKSVEELEGLRRALHAAEEALVAMKLRLQSSVPTTSDDLRDIANRVYADNGAVGHEMRTIVACGPVSADPHAEGDGSIEPNQPIVLDLFPRDLASGCWGDLARTLCLGQAPGRLRRYHEEVREAQRLATDAVRPGIATTELNRIAAQFLAENGHETRLGKSADKLPAEGFIHSLGHGIGLDVHEPPRIDYGSSGELAVGDVITIEPGVYYRDFGGVRIEDTILVTEGGHEVLNSLPYELEV